MRALAIAGLLLWACGQVVVAEVRDYVDLFSMSLE